MNNFSEPCDLVVKALRNVQAGLGGAMAPTGKVDTGRMKYRHLELDVILKTALPLLNENGLTLMHSQTAEGMDCYLFHESGQWLRTHASVGVDDKMTAQEVGSAASYGRRYSAVAMFGIAAGDDDDGAAATKAKKQKLEAPTLPETQMPEDGAMVRFATTLHEAGVTMPWSEICQICASRNYPTPDKMDDPTLERLTKFLIKEHGRTAA